MAVAVRLHGLEHDALSGPFAYHSITRSVLNTQLFSASPPCPRSICRRLVSEREGFAPRARRRRSPAGGGGACERRRLERNLHDGAQQRLTWLAVDLRRAAARARKSPEEAPALLEKAEAELGLAIDELRDFAHGIHPSVLTDLGLATAIRGAALRSSVAVSLLELPDRRVDEAAETTAYYVFAEAVANAQKHAYASSIDVSIAFRVGRSTSRSQTTAPAAPPSRGPASRACGTGWRPSAAASASPAHAASGRSSPRRSRPRSPSRHPRGQGHCCAARRPRPTPAAGPQVNPDRGSADITRSRVGGEHGGLLGVELGVAEDTLVVQRREPLQVGVAAGCRRRGDRGGRCVLAAGLGRRPAWVRCSVHAVAEVTFGVIGEFAYRQPAERFDADRSQDDQDGCDDRVAGGGYRRPGQAGPARCRRRCRRRLPARADTGSDSCEHETARWPGPANQVPIKSSSPTITVVRLAAPSRSVATHQIAWPASRFCGNVVSESISSFPTTRRTKIRTTAAASTPIAIARSVFRRSREMRHRDRKHRQPQQAERNRRQPQELHTGLCRAQLIALREHDLAGARRQRDRAVGALRKRAGKVPDDRAEIDRHRAVGGRATAPTRRSGSSSADRGREDSRRATAPPPADAPDRRPPPAECRAPRPPRSAPPTAATAAEAPATAPPAHPHSCTAGRPGTPTPRFAPPAAATPSVLVSDQAVESSATRSTQVAKIATHNINEPRNTSTPTASFRRRLFPGRGSAGRLACGRWRCLLDLGHRAVPPTLGDRSRYATISVDLLPCRRASPHPLWVTASGRWQRPRPSSQPDDAARG